MTDPIARLNTALEGCYRVERRSARSEIPGPLPLLLPRRRLIK